MGRAILVLDMKGFAMGHLSNYYLTHLKEFGRLLGRHYVERLHKAIIINAPSWINMGWKIAVGVMGA